MTLPSCIDAALQVRIDEDGGVRLLEHGRPFDHRADRQVEPRQNLRLLPCAAAPHRPRALGRFFQRRVRTGREGRQIEGRAAADRGGAQRHDADRDARQQPAEGGGIGFIERRAHRSPLRADTSAATKRHRQRHGHRMGLPQVMHVEFEIDVDAINRDAGRLHHRARLLARRRHARGQRRWCRGHRPSD